MVELANTATSYRSGLEAAISGQSYFLLMPGPARAATLSAGLCTAVERLGKPYGVLRTLPRLNIATERLPRPHRLFDEMFSMKDEHSGAAISNLPYRIETADGVQILGTTDATGETVRLYSDTTQPIKTLKE